MIRNLWRYSHFALAAFSALFILLATITGLILAFEPIENKLQGFKAPEAEELSIAQLIQPLQEQYEEVLEVEVDANYFVKASVISMDESLNGDFYIAPSTGKKIGDIPDKRPLFEFMTNFHRSLFLKTPGRIFVGVISFLLFLIALTGLLLFIERQKGVRHLFDKIIKEGFAHYYHVITGRIMLVPVIIIALTGVYLSLLRFSIIPDAKPLEQAVITHTKTTKLPIAEFPIFKETPLAELRKIEFPFSDDEEDYFIVSLRDRQLNVNQKTGAIVKELHYPFVNRLSEWSFNLHTGSGSVLWSIILAIAALNILFFIYSGAIISLQRLRSRVQNTYRPQEAEIIILVGSENGTTRNFGKLLQQALLKVKKKVFLDDLNRYQHYPQMQQLVVLTSTYGVGDPPANAANFLQRFEQSPPIHPISYSVVGFGSLAYPDFCQFALDVEMQLSQQKECTALDPPFLIHNKSYTSFKTWAEKWGKKLNVFLELPTQFQQKSIKKYPFKVTRKEIVHDGFGETFLLELQSAAISKFQSGDLLGITPPDDSIERLYSIAKMQKDTLLLSIKRHELGICSNYLYGLSPGQIIQSSIQPNKHFHLPNTTTSVTLIANGTGIAPFLGMIQESQKKSPIHLYWGGKTPDSFSLYKEQIEKAYQAEQLNSYQLAFSKGDTPDKYVQDLLLKEGAIIVDRLEKGGSILICGSIAMQNDVLAFLDQLCLQYSKIRLNTYQVKGQILMDCY